MINRLQATRFIVAHVTDEPIIASLGNAKYDLFTAKDRPQNFYMWNSMGLASSMGLGLAMARPQQKVIILDGDGAVGYDAQQIARAAFHGGDIAVDDQPVPHEGGFGRRRC